jgi:hypothetical protein
MNPTITPFRDWGQVFYRAHYFFGGRIISRTFNTPNQAQQWLDQRTKAHS